MNECIFCKIANGEIPSKKIYEDDVVIAFLDISPKVDGHTLIVPKKHVTDFKELDDKTLLHIYNVSKKLTDLLMQKLNVKAITLGANYGDSQVVKHFHLHLLPNFGVKPTKTVDEVYEILTK